MTGDSADGRQQKGPTVGEVARDVQAFAMTARGIVDTGAEAFYAGTVQGDILRRAARSLILDLHTAVGHLPQDVLDAHPEIPWSDIRATRNYLAHGYAAVEDEIVWAAMDGRIEEVADALAEYR